MQGEKPTGYWEKVDEEGSRMLDRIAANARHRAEANGDDEYVTSLAFGLKKFLVFTGQR